MAPDLLDYLAEQTRHMHRGVETSIAAAEHKVKTAKGDLMLTLGTIQRLGGATYKEIDLACGRGGPDSLQPRVSNLESDGYIVPLVIKGEIVKRDHCRVMIITRAGLLALRANNA